MKHRRPSLGNDQGPDDDPPGGQTPRWDAPLRYTLASCVVVSVTFVTGSVTDGMWAVSVVAAAAHGIPRLRNMI